MKSLRILLLTGFTGLVSLLHAQPAATLRPSFTLQTAHFSIAFQVGADGRLYQRAIGDDEKAKSKRWDEAYPQAGDGYFWEPALQAVHADGNTSTALQYVSQTRATEADGRELTRVLLRDPAYPFEVTLCFRTDRERDVIEQWTEIRHHETGAVTLERMASTSLLLPPKNLYLRHFSGDWAKEMNPTTELLTPGTKVLDSKIGVRAHQFGNPSFILSLDGINLKGSGRVLSIHSSLLLVNISPKLLIAHQLGSPGPELTD